MVLKKETPRFTSLTGTRDASRRAANSSSRVDNTKNHQNKAVDIWIDLSFSMKETILIVLA